MHDLGLECGMHELGREMLPLTTLAISTVSVVLNLGILCGIKLMLGEVAFCLQTLGTPQGSLSLFQSEMTYIYERELF